MCSWLANCFVYIVEIIAHLAPDLFAFRGTQSLTFVFNIKNPNLCLADSIPNFVFNIKNL